MNVLEVLKTNRIEYHEAGEKNVGAGSVGIPCPFCSDDPSWHMMIRLRDGSWSCWRNQAHRGKNLARLLAKVLGVGITQATLLLGSPNPDELAEHVHNAFSRPLPEMNRASACVAWPEHCISITKGRTELTKPAWVYLLGRQFSPKQIRSLCNQYDLRYCLAGRYAQRICFPITNPNGGLMGVNARAVTRNPEMRYLSYPGGVGVKAGFFGCSRLLEGGINLYIVEGPFDALKILSLTNSDQAVPLLGMKATSEQIALLSRIGPRYSNIYILLDHAALQQALELQRTLSFLSPIVRQLPRWVKDPGELVSLDCLEAKNETSPTEKA